VYRITKEVQFDAGHRIPDHESKCRNPHGHRYKVEATIAGDLRTGGSDNGMVLDFGDLKNLMMEYIHDVLDHGFIVYHNDVLMWHALNAAFQLGGYDWKIIEFPYIPTAENLALWCFEQLEGPVQEMHCMLDSVTVYETPTSKATYIPEV
jgi:6-pyruvoyltetrahydropterin/6-carboxytetrahydropterin synthase